jgi:hypothetical protein
LTKKRFVFRVDELFLAAVPLCCIAGFIMLFLPVITFRNGSMNVFALVSDANMPGCGYLIVPLFFYTVIAVAAAVFFVWRRIGVYVPYFLAFSVVAFVMAAVMFITFRISSPASVTVVMSLNAPAGYGDGLTGSIVTAFIAAAVSLTGSIVGFVRGAKAM